MVLSLIAATIIINFHLLAAIRQSLYKRTQNLTASSWSSAMKSELSVSTHYQCAAVCLKKQDSCNAWQFNKNERFCALGQVCKRVMFKNPYQYLFQVEYLEDSDGTPVVEVYVDVETIEEVDMICRGSKYRERFLEISQFCQKCSDKIKSFTIHYNYINLRIMIVGSRCCTIKPCGLMEGECTTDTDCFTG